MSVPLYGQPRCQTIGGVSFSTQILRYTRSSEVWRPTANHAATIASKLSYEHLGFHRLAPLFVIVQKWRSRGGFADEGDQRRI